MPPHRPTKKQLEKSNIQVETSPGVIERVFPVKALPRAFDKFLPPAGLYYDQSVLEMTPHTFDGDKKCYLCWNLKSEGQECTCHNPCAVCGTKAHRRAGCPELYADANWWLARGRKLRSKHQRRPIPGERAYLVVAGVLKDWRKMEDPVVVNMNHPEVKAFYKHKSPPSAVSFLHQGRRPRHGPSVPYAVFAKIEGSLDATATLTKRSAVSNTLSSTTLTSPQKVSVIVKKEDDECGWNDKAGNVTDLQATTATARSDDSTQVGLLYKAWSTPSHHASFIQPTITPLSIRLAFATLQQFSSIQKPVTPIGNEMHVDQDPRLGARSPPRTVPDDSQPPTTRELAVDHSHCEREIQRTEDDFMRCYKELEVAREEIRVNRHRIRELELALHEQEGWTDAVTYRVGEKRPRP